MSQQYNTLVAHPNVVKAVQDDNHMEAEALAQFAADLHAAVSNQGQQTFTVTTGEAAPNTVASGGLFNGLEPDWESIPLVNTPIDLQPITPFNPNYIFIPAVFPAVTHMPPEAQLLAGVTVFATREAILQMLGKNDGTHLMLERGSDGMKFQYHGSFIPVPYQQDDKLWLCYPTGFRVRLFVDEAGPAPVPVAPPAVFDFKDLYAEEDEFYAREA